MKCEEIIKLTTSHFSFSTSFNGFSVLFSDVSVCLLYRHTSHPQLDLDQQIYFVRVGFGIFLGPPSLPNGSRLVDKDDQEEDEETLHHHTILRIIRGQHIKTHKQLIP